MRHRMVVILLVVSSAMALAKGGGRATNVPVTSYLADLDGNNNLNSIASDGLQGPVKGQLGEYDNGFQSISSILTANTYHSMPPGDWQLDVLSSSTRTVRITLGPNNQIAPGGAFPQPQGSAPYVGTQNIPAHVEDQCTAVFNSSLGTYQDMGTMNQVGQAYACPAVIAFPYNLKKGSAYRLVMYGNHPGGITTYPETTQVWVQCTSVDASSVCNGWDMDPLPSTQPGYNANGAIARLVQVPVSGPLVILGDYYMTFHWHVTRP